jgi:hypothetical protein
MESGRQVTRSTDDSSNFELIVTEVTNPSSAFDGVSTGAIETSGVSRNEP